MITSFIPDDWRGLQHQVAQILRECGFTVKVEEVIDAARGKVEIDVFAEEDVQGRKYKIFCECKQWKTRVPQNVIHSFRTVVSDTGANLGYIVSSAGFQSGAFSAVELTNIRLVTWRQFQEEFEKRWLKHYLASASQRFKTFNVLFTPINNQLLGSELPNVNQGAITALLLKYRAFWWLVNSCLRGDIWIGQRRRISEWGMMDESMFAWEEIPSSILNAGSYRDYLEAVIAYADTAVSDYVRILNER